MAVVTKTKIDTTVPSATADIGIRVCVTVDDSDVGVSPLSCAIYDQRFQQISSQLFSQLTECTAHNFRTCTTDADCTGFGTGVTCQAGSCIGPNPLCNFELVLSTLSAHSFDFVIAVDNKKPHKVKAAWDTVGLPSNPNATVASCVGPGILTVTQTKVFNDSGSLTFSSN